MEGSNQTLVALASAVDRCRQLVRHLVRRQGVLCDSVTHLHSEHRASLRRADHVQEDKRVVETERESLQARVDLLESEMKVRPEPNPTPTRTLNPSLTLTLTPLPILPR